MQSGNDPNTGTKVERAFRKHWILCWYIKLGIIQFMDRAKHHDVVFGGLKSNFTTKKSIKFQDDWPRIFVSNFSPNVSCS